MRSLNMPRWLSGPTMPPSRCCRQSSLGRVQPVHVELIVERGIYLVEWLGLEEMAASGHSEFLFICLPLKITGGTGSLVRPVAVV